MTLMRRDPWRELETMRRSMDRIFHDVWRPLGDGGSVGNLALDIIEEGDKFLVEASLPGVDPENVNISVAGRNLTIEAETRTEEEHKEERYLTRERYFGSVTRTVLLPAEVESDQAKAEYKNGVLRLTLPKAAAERTRKIAFHKAP